MVDPEKVDLDALIKQSSSVILQYQESNGAYPASPHFEVYNYSWLRDGSFIADGMSRVGEISSAEKFFDWCAAIVLSRRDFIQGGGKLPARYTYDGQEAEVEWSEFQLDGYGTLLWAMRQHADRHNAEISRYDEMAGLLQAYLIRNWREHCFDWWEERKGIHAASLACIYAGLAAYDNPQADEVRQNINLSEERTDASLLACALLGAVSNDDFTPTLERIHNELISPDGGVYRYRDDVYYGGGEWPVLTCMLGWYYAELGKMGEAKKSLAWTAALIDERGCLPEQSQAHMLHPEAFDEWVLRWGRPAQPLLWSHAMLLTLATRIRNQGTRCKC